MVKGLSIIFLTMFIDLLGFGLIIPILPIYGEQLGATGWMIGMIVASYSLMQFIFAPFWGGLSDRYGRKPILMVSIAINVLGYVFFANTSNLIFLFLSRTFSGIGSANISVAQAYISDVTAPENRAKSFGLIGVAFGLGFIFGPPVGGFLKEFYGVASLGYSASALSLINLAFVYFFLKESNHNLRYENLGLKNPIKHIIEAFKIPIVSEIITITFIYVSAFSMMHITASLLWDSEYGLSEAEIGYMFAFIGFSVVVVQGFFVGPASKKWGEEKLLSIGCILMAIGLGSMPFVPKELLFPFMFVSLTFIAFGNGFLSPPLQSILSKSVSNSEQGRIMGVYQSVSSLSRVVGPIIGASFFDLYFSYPYLLSSSMMIVCFIFAQKLFRNV